jgi:upstream activation factor subunit UAF30
MASVEDISKLFSEIKALHRDIRKIRQHLEDPTGEKAKARSENNGFKKPIKVDDALRGFLNLKPGELVSRSDVTKAINSYAETHKLKEGQVINLDAALKSLLNPPEGEVVTFLKLQKYLAPHYIKDTPVDKVVDPVPVAADVVPPKKPVVKKKN